MRKAFTFAAAILLCGTLVSAQDFQKVTELAKQANEELVGGNAQAAINNFKAAIDGAASCTEDGVADLVANCKKGIALANNSLANTMIEGGQLEEALKQLEATMAAAVEAGDEELAQKVDQKTTQLHQALANAKINAAKTAADPATKVATYKEALAHLDIALEKDGENGKLYLQKGQILGSIGDKAAAVESFLKAKELGMETVADKQLSTIFVKEAAAKLKAKDFKGAIDAAMKSNEYFESANAYKIAGTAANGMKDLEHAAEYLGKYIELAPNAKDVEQMKAAVAAIKANIGK